MQDAPIRLYYPCRYLSIINPFEFFILLMPKWFILPTIGAKAAAIMYGILKYIPDGLLIDLKKDYK